MWQFWRNIKIEIHQISRFGQYIYFENKLCMISLIIIFIFWNMSHKYANFMLVRKFDLYTCAIIIRFPGIGLYWTIVHLTKVARDW